MSCLWNCTNYSEPPSGIPLLVKYNQLRSDCPFGYVVARYDGSWKSDFIVDGGYLKQSIIPTPDWWAYIESEDDHG